jgi:hypothetical protein
VIVHESPGKNSGFGLFGKITNTAEKIFFIVIVTEYRYPFDPADHNVVQCSRSV